MLLLVFNAALEEADLGASLQSQVRLQLLPLRRLYKVRRLELQQRRSDAQAPGAAAVTSTEDAAATKQRTLIRRAEHCRLCSPVAAPML
jgi:hypothetical protein